MIYIFANWKMNPTSLQEARELTSGTIKLLNNFNWQKEVEVILMPPFVWLPEVKTQIDASGLDVKLGAQNVFWKNKGAYTGEVSPLMLKNLSCEYILVGHSEREIYLKEDLKFVKKKLEAVLKNNMIPILCLHPQDETNLKHILEELLADFSQEKLENIFYLYEPTEAISTQESKLPSREKVEKMRQTIQDFASQSATILYGGSIEASNVVRFTKQVGLDGALIGSKSLQADAFTEIVKNIS